jgi:hypothetical protein
LFDIRYSIFDISFPLRFRVLRDKGLMKYPHPSGAVILAAVVAMAGCQVVHVVDQHGQPIPGVELTSQYVDQAGDAGDGPAAVTDSFGNASLIRPAFRGNPTWLTLRKQGYMPRGIDYPSQWRVTVPMESISAPTP